MATTAEFNAMIARFDTETTRLGAVIDDYVARLTQTGISAADEKAALDGLSAVADRLGALGATPTDPIPDNPPV